jgi:hypothetical protein
MRTHYVTLCHGNSTSNLTHPPHSGHRPSWARFAREIIVTLSLVAGGALAPQEVCAGQIVYNIVNYPDDQGGLDVSGTITTDGNKGILDASDIVAWSVTIDNTTFTSAFPNVTENVLNSGFHD